MGMSKAEIKAKHPPGTSPLHIEAMHKYMAKGDSFENAHNKAQVRFPALGNTGLGHCGCAVPTCPSCNKGMGITKVRLVGTPQDALMAFILGLAIPPFVLLVKRIFSE
jgi:hypothetical protein